MGTDGEIGVSSTKEPTGTLAGQVMGPQEPGEGQPSITCMPAAPQQPWAAAEG